MALVTTKRNVDVLPGQAAPTVFHCSQHDVGATIILGLVNAGGNYSIPSGVTAIIQGSCSNGAVFTPVTATVSGSDITFNLSEEMTSIAGPTVCEAVLSKDTDALGTANFILDVEPSAMGSDTPPVFADAAWLWMVDKMGSETVSALGDKTVIDAINEKANQSDVTALSDAKLNKNQGTANAGKYLKVGADGNVETADLDVTTDKTLSIADKAADAKTVGDEITNLKADLSNTIELVKSKNLYNPDTIEPGYVNQTNGTIVSSQTSSHSDFIPVSGVFTISVDSLLNTGFRYAIYNSQKTYITGENLPSFRTAESGRLYLTVSNANAAYLRFSDRTDRMAREWQVENGEEPTSYEAYYNYLKLKDTVSVEIGQVNNLENRLGALEDTAEDVSDLDEDVAGLVTSMEAIAKTEEYVDYITDIYTGPYTSGYMPPAGTPAPSSTFWYTEKISVQPGDVLYGKTTDGTINVNFRFVCAYSGETVVQSAGNTLDYPSYTVPDGIDGVVVSQRAVSNEKTRCVEIKRTRNKSATNIKKNSMGYMRASGDMQSGDELHVSENNVKNNVCVTFTANVTTFSKLCLGQRGVSGWYSCYLEIDATNLTIHTDQGDVVNAHGLSIGSDIQVFIETENEIKTKKIAIYSDGDAYIDTVAHRWICDKGYAAALSDESVLTDCVLAWTSRNINNPVWIFGDSYVSLYDVRWVYWMIQDGFTMPMINGFAGENSAQAMIALKNLLECRKPQYILWALGMNDGDTVSAVNASWKNNFDIVVSLCKKYAITPIFATVPSVQTVNNSFKNTIIRGSGCRYIDFAKAVDPDEDGNWIAGALSNDGVHPSVTGAKILYMRALADFPELMSY